MNEIIVMIKEVMYKNTSKSKLLMIKNLEKYRKAGLYSIGLLIIMPVWFIMRATELSTLSLLRLALLIIFSYIAMVVDILTKKIPNKLVLLMFFVWLMLILPLTLYDKQTGIKVLTDSLFGLLVGGGLFLLVYLINRKGLGGGDVKFMAAVGLYLGFADTLPAILYGTVLAALFGLVLLLIRKLGSKDTMPLAPFMFVGILIMVFT